MECAPPQQKSTLWLLNTVTVCGQRSATSRTIMSLVIVFGAASVCDSPWPQQQPPSRWAANFSLIVLMKLMLLSPLDFFVQKLDEGLRVDPVSACRKLNGDKARWVVLHRRQTAQSAMNQHRPNLGMDLEQFGDARRQLDD